MNIKFYGPRSKGMLCEHFFRCISSSLRVYRIRFQVFDYFIKLSWIVDYCHNRSKKLRQSPDVVAYNDGATGYGIKHPIRNNPPTAHVIPMVIQDYLRTAIKRAQLIISN